MSNKVTFYTVLRADGKLKMRRRHIQVYRSVAAASRWALFHGDSVVAMEIDMDRAPLFIRGQTL